MSVSSDFREANVFFNEIKQAFEQARQRFENDVSRLAGLSDDDPIASSAASGWKNWTKSLRSHVLGVAAETHTSNEMVQAILGSSVHTDPDTRLIFADETGMPRLNQEYKTISSETPSRLGRTAVTNEASDAVGQLGVPARSQAGDMSQAVIHVKNTNPWPCTERLPKP
ncbi:hypothetical protein [Falsihalocynthiibacter sp. CO-5D18]|uniref:hypothetical protein n=1 Tax=Falsihalocynthiibacter sp. CO-5D18 TaxID=3240872 RepID=UPI00350F25B4